MNEVWDAWGPVVIAAIAALPVAGSVARWRARRRGWRVALCEVGMVVGTAPWIWMILTPAGSGRSISPVPSRDLAAVLSDDHAVAQVGGNLLVFAALGFLLPVRVPWFTRPWRVLLLAASTSTAIEILQFGLAIGRHTSVDDVLLNAVGAYAAAWLSRPLWKARSAPAEPLAPMTTERNQQVDSSFHA